MYVILCVHCLGRYAESPHSQVGLASWHAKLPKRQAVDVHGTATGNWPRIDMRSAANNIGAAATTLRFFSPAWNLHSALIL
eukprot:4034696-Amphidinium_carterae.1